MRLPKILRKSTCGEALCGTRVKEAMPKIIAIQNSALAVLKNRKGGKVETERYS